MINRQQEPTPKPSPGAAGEGWYYLEKAGIYTHEKGPLAAHEVRQLFAAGRLDASTPLRSGDMTYWCPASRVTAFAGAAAAKKPLARWAVLLTAFAVIALGGVLLLSTQRGVSVPGAAASGPALKKIPVVLNTALTARDVIGSTNRVRRDEAGLTPLSENPTLDEIARERLDDMFRRQYFAHVSPSGDSAPEVAQRTGYAYKYLGENIAMGHFGTADKMVQTWMQSPGHRKNILTDKCSELGVAIGKGVMDGEEVWIGVQIFGQPAPREITQKTE